MFYCVTCLLFKHNNSNALSLAPHVSWWCHGIETALWETIPPVAGGSLGSWNITKIQYIPGNVHTSLCWLGLLQLQHNDNVYSWEIPAIFIWVPSLPMTIIKTLWRLLIVWPILCTTMANINARFWSMVTVLGNGRRWCKCNVCSHCRKPSLVIGRKRTRARYYRWLCARLQ